jgi:hypothetical protein
MPETGPHRFRPSRRLSCGLSDKRAKKKRIPCLEVRIRQHFHTTIERISVPATHTSTRVTSKMRRGHACHPDIIWRKSFFRPFHTNSYSTICWPIATPAPGRVPVQTDPSKHFTSVCSLRLSWNEETESKAGDRTNPVPWRAASTVNISVTLRSLNMTWYRPVQQTPRQELGLNSNS